ncbi:hypothetical protein ANANG_G00227960 [Anguilla anguilla]|uniref:Uncharacterized protein n=1 Tax=Anguilla anguilla TaxID=7936 RepID=A0A9D3LXM3_ANGAN|nr:hypothetical protein ANANG_G00227960 [Anguilla anguilla]
MPPSLARVFKKKTRKSSQSRFGCFPPSAPAEDRLTLSLTGRDTAKDGRAAERACL